MKLEELVTEDYFESRLEVRFTQQQTYIDMRFTEQTACIERRFAEINAHFRTLYWILAVVVVATVGPQLERLISI